MPIGYGGGMFGNLLYQLEYWGVRDVILPFVIIFTIFFAVLQRTNLFGDKSKKYNVTISLVIALLVVIPHALNAYPPGADVVSIINSAIPSFALLTVAIVLLLMMIGIGAGKAMTADWIIWLGCILLGLIFLAAMWPIPFLSQLFYSIDPGVQALIIMLIVFGLIVRWITSEKTTTPQGQVPPETFLEKLMKYREYK